MRINNLIARFLVNKATKEEWETLESWKQESQDNLNELLEMQSIWKDSIDLKEYKTFDKKAAWEVLDEKIDAEPLPTSGKMLSFKWISGIAAAITLAVCSILLFQNEMTEGYHHISTDNVVENFKLPDGSDIHINKNSDLLYASNFNENRSLILDGEAYFDVARNEEVPFVIETNEATITVLGTSFNIVENKNSVDVLVTSGQVKVVAGDQVEVLTRNQMVRCQDGSITKLSIPGGNYLSWKTKTLIFEETPLHVVIKDLSRHYGRKVVFAGDSKAMNHQITDTFENEDFESVLETLVLITGIKYIKERNSYVIQ